VSRDQDDEASLYSTINADCLVTYSEYDGMPNAIQQLRKSGYLGVFDFSVGRARWRTGR